eukprot:COSAG01_NODE_99_length_26583_cov_79.512536_6_plen_144_part_00
MVEGVLQDWGSWLLALNSQQQQRQEQQQQEQQQQEEGIPPLAAAELQPEPEPEHEPEHAPPQAPPPPRPRRGLFRLCRSSGRSVDGEPPPPPPTPPPPPQRCRIPCCREAPTTMPPHLPMADAAAQATSERGASISSRAVHAD